MQHFTPEEIILLSEPLTNRDLAAKLNRTIAAVRQKRTALGIPAPKKSDLTIEEIYARAEKIRSERKVKRNRNRYTIPEVRRPYIGSGDADDKFRRN